jgi:hypothetical protein
MIGTFFGFTLVFPLLDIFRRSLDGSLRVVSPLNSLLSGDYDAFFEINNAVNYVDHLGITWGNQALGVLLFWVPRSIWPTKPVDTGVLLATFRGYGFTNISAPLPAEMFINGGWPVLVVGMIAFGFALGRWDVAIERRLTSAGILPILGCVIPFYLLIVLRGSLLQSMAFLSVVLVATLFVSQRPHERHVGASQPFDPARDPVPTDTQARR